MIKYRESANSLWKNYEYPSCQFYQKDLIVHVPWKCSNKNVNKAIFVGKLLMCPYYFNYLNKISINAEKWLTSKRNDISFY